MKRIAVLVATVLALLAGSSVPAAAAHPEVGAFHGDHGVSFTVRLSPHGTPTIHDLRYHAHHGFEVVFVHGGAFESCARVRINAVLFRDYCVTGDFGAERHASGTVKIYHGAHGHRAAHPSETHHWAATHQG